MERNIVAIIGGNGFVGTRLSARFNKSKIISKRYDINISKKNEEVIDCDIEDINALDQLEAVDTIINLAAVHRDDVRPISRYDDVNVQGAKNICNAARKYKIKKSSCCS